MAVAQTKQWVSTAPYVKLTVTQASSNGGAALYDWKLQYIASSAANTNTTREYVVKIAGETVRTGNYNIDGKTGTNTIAQGQVTIPRSTGSRTIQIYCSFAFNLTWSGTYAGRLTATDSFTLAAKTSYKITYNANGGSGAPGQQTKWYGTDLKLSNAIPARAGYAFQGWATSASGSVAYARGATYSANAAVTLYAVWKEVSYTITYNANGGTVSPASVTKKHDVAIKLPTATRTDHTFLGWAISASSSVVSYAAGASYNGNADATLHAVWEKNYTKPVITSYSVARCDANGNANDEGTCAKVVFKWECSKNVSSIVVSWKATTETSEQSKTISVSGTSGTVSAIVGDSALSTEKAYSITVTVADSGGSSFAVRTLGGTAYPIDFLRGGNGTAVGKSAEVPNLFDVGWLARFRNDLMVGLKEGYLDGKQGVYLDSEGFMHLQRTTEQGYHPYIGFFLDAETEASAMVRLNSESKALELRGDDISHYVGNLATPGSYRPYYRAGDVITVNIRTAGYCTNSKEDIYFVVPLSRPVIGNPTVSCASVDGLILRQEGNYTHGSASSSPVKPTSYTESISEDGNYIQVCAKRGTTTDAINNHLIGVHWSGTITFS